MTTKFTPGPLEAARAAWRRIGRAKLNGDLDVFRAADNEMRLMASAPELLAALTETLRALESHLDESTRDHNLGHRYNLCPCNRNEVQRARAAIARATGEQS